MTHPVPIEVVHKGGIGLGLAPQPQEPAAHLYLGTAPTRSEQSLNMQLRSHREMP